MKRTILILLLVILGFCLGLLIQTDPGYVLFSYGSTTIETTLWFALFALAGTLFLIFVTAKIFSHILTSPFQIKKWMSHRKQKQQEACTHLAIEAFLESDWRNAINHAQNASHSSKKSGMMSLFASTIASLSHQHHEARQLLMTDTELSLTHRIVDASLLLRENKLDMAKLQLQHLQQEKPYHAGISRLLLEVYEKSQAWRSMRDLATICKKHQLLPLEEQRHYEIQSNTSLLAQIESLEEAEALWYSINRETKKEPQIIAAYLETLGRLNEFEQLSKKVRKMIGKPPEKEILLTARPLCTKESKATLKWLENLENKFGPSADLYLLKALCLKAQNLSAMALKLVEQGLALDPLHKELLEQIHSPN